MYVLFLLTVKTFGKTLRILMPCLETGKNKRISNRNGQNHYQSSTGKDDSD